MKVLKFFLFYFLLTVTRFVGDHVGLSDDLFEDIPEGKLPDLPKGDGALCKSVRKYLSGVDDSFGTLPPKVQVCFFF